MAVEKELNRHLKQLHEQRLLTLALDGRSMVRVNESQNEADFWTVTGGVVRTIRCPLQTLRLADVPFCKKELAVTSNGNKCNLCFAD